MGNLFPLLLLIGTWFVTLVLLYLIHSYKLQKVHSEMGAESENRSYFPKWYNALSTVMLVFYIGFFIGFGFGFPIVLSYLQEFFFKDKDTIIFLAPNTVIATMLPSLFLGISLGALLLKSLVSLFPSFDRFQARKSRQHVRYEWNWILLFSVISWLMAGPFYILSMDNYIALKQDGLIHNEFLRFTETKYSWQDIDKARVYADVSWDNEDGDWDVTPHFDIVVNTGKAIDIWGGFGFGSPSGESLIKAADILNLKGIEIELEPISNPQALAKYTAESDVQKLFTHLEQR